MMNNTSVNKLKFKFNKKHNKKEKQTCSPYTNHQTKTETKRIRKYYYFVSIKVYHKF